jgi:ABC-type multidrug transport system ATPase subunit
MTITVSNLGKRFNHDWIFRGLNATFKAGTVYGITGPNGSGKSTLMQVLWGQVPPSAGVVHYQTEAGAIPVEDAFRHVAIAAPYMELLEDFTLQEQLDFHFKFKAASLGASTDALLEKLALTTARHKPIKQFSSGMKQRVKLGLALFSSSTAIFLDEPTTNLDETATAWYHTHLTNVAADKVVFIATNQPTDYPASTSIVDLTTLKPGYKPA